MLKHCIFLLPIAIFLPHYCNFSAIILHFSAIGICHRHAKFNMCKLFCNRLQISPANYNFPAIQLHFFAIWLHFSSIWLYFLQLGSATGMHNKINANCSVTGCRFPLPIAIFPQFNCTFCNLIAFFFNWDLQPTCNIQYLQNQVADAYCQLQFSCNPIALFCNLIAFFCNLDLHLLFKCSWRWEKNVIPLVTLLVTFLWNQISQTISQPDK